MVWAYLFRCSLFPLMQQQILDHHHHLPDLPSALLQWNKEGEGEEEEAEEEEKEGDGEEGVRERERERGRGRGRRRDRGWNQLVLPLPDFLCPNRPPPPPPPPPRCSMIACWEVCTSSDVTYWL